MHTVTQLRNSTANCYAKLATEEGLQITSTKSSFCFGYPFILPLVICDYPFIREPKKATVVDLASKKGIAITAAIVIGIVGASFLIWTIPQSSPDTVIAPPRTDAEILGDIYSRHNNLAADLESKFNDWKQGEVTSESMLAQISLDRSDIQNMRTQLENAQPAQEWQESYDLYVQALDSFLEYVDAMEMRVEDNGKSDVDPELDGLKMKWENYIDESINAVRFSE